MLQRARLVFASLAFLFILPLSIPSGFAASPPFAEGVVLVGFKPGTPEAARAEARALGGAMGSERVTPLDPTLEKLSLRAGQSVPAAIEALLRNPNVRYAEPDYILTKAVTSDDPSFTNGSLWGMYGAQTSPSNAYGSNAAAAWARGYTGSRSVYVGVIDEGIQFTHPDLAGNVWSNPFDGCGASVDGVDSDGNGKVDDCNGWDFFNNDRTVYDGTGDDHGTHVAGTIGAVGGNGTGVAGVNWEVTLISAKFLGATGGYTSGAIAAVDYITDLKKRHGLNIVATSNSWGGGGYTQSLRDAIRRGGDAGILFIAAAGNNSSNNDAVANYPSNYDCSFTFAGQARGWDCVIAVASITSTGALSSFSNYGATMVDIGAPGSSITSTLPSNTYGSYSGTSMATPHVSGAAALCASINPTLTAREIKDNILNSAVATPSLAGVTSTGGRLDVGEMATLCESAVVSPVSGAPGNLTASAVSTASIGLTWTDAVSDETSFVIELSDTGCLGTFRSAGTALAGSTSTLVTGLAPGTAYCFRVAGRNSLGTGAWSNTASATTPAAPPNAPSSVTTSLSRDKRTVTIGWIDNSTNETGFEVRRLKRNTNGTWPTADFTNLTNLQLVGNPLANARSTTDTPGAGTYRYYVLAVNGSLTSAWASSASKGVTVQ